MTKKVVEVFAKTVPLFYTKKKVAKISPKKFLSFSLQTEKVAKVPP